MCKIIVTIILLEMSLFQNTALGANTILKGAGAASPYPFRFQSMLRLESIFLIVLAVLALLLVRQVQKKTKLLYEKNDELSREIEERMAAQKKLQESEQRYRSVFENTGTAIIIIEEDTTISIVNSEFEKLSGYKKEDIERKMSWMQFVAAVDLERAKQHRQMRIEGLADVPSKYEFRLTGATGTEKVVLIKVGTIPGTGLTIASLLDISSRKTLWNMIINHFRMPCLVHERSADKIKIRNILPGSYRLC